jgi:hypothetical protein
MSTCQCGQAHGACTTEFQYAVKIVCGDVKATTEGALSPPVAPGRYWTAVNVHNPDKCKVAHFRVKLAVANQDSKGPVSPHYGLTLNPDAAIEFDCPLIKAIVQILFPPPQSPPPFVKGYLVIESDIELDVVAVYTAAQTPSGPITTFSTERVPPRCVPVCEDLVLPLHTGLAAWQSVSPTAGQLGPVVPVSNPGWTAPLPVGAQWVSQTSADGANATSTANTAPRTYELCFDLCSGFEVPAAFPIQVLADDTATVFLNGLPPGGDWRHYCSMEHANEYYRPVSVPPADPPRRPQLLPGCRD